MIKILYVGPRDVRKATSGTREFHAQTVEALRGKGHEVAYLANYLHFGPSTDNIGLQLHYHSRPGPHAHPRIERDVLVYDMRAIHDASFRPERRAELFEIQEAHYLSAQRVPVIVLADAPIAGLIQPVSRQRGFTQFNEPWSTQEIVEAVSRIRLPTTSAKQAS